MHNWSTGSGYSLNKNRYVDPAQKGKSKKGKKQYCYWSSCKPDPAQILAKIKRPQNGAVSDSERTCQ